MNIIPIQVTDEGVLIPKTYLGNAKEVDVVISGDYFLIKPRQQAMPQPPPAPVVEISPAQRTQVNQPPVSQPPVSQPPVSPPRRNPLLAGARSRNPQGAASAETRLENEADRRNFTLQTGKPGSEFDLDAGA